MPSPDIDNQINPDKVAFLKPVVDYFEPLPIQIFVKTLTGETITVNLEPDDLVLEIMEQVASKTNVPVLEQRLQFAGKQLELDKPITHYNLVKENTLHLVGGRLRGGIGEYSVARKFLQAQITHGNVTGLITKESAIALELIRSDNFNLPQVRANILADINFAPGYADAGLQELCFSSMLVEEFNGGNCNEMANWTAVQLIESTRDQWVYICYLVGTFPLLGTIDVNDVNHVLYRSDLGRVSNALDHVMVITYPDEVNSIADMNANKATVVDTWYNHLICSLADYKATMHPYYSYAYSTNQALALVNGNFAIQRKFEAIGTPFSNDKTVAKQGAQNVKADAYQYYQNAAFPPPVTKYQFAIQPRIQDARSVANLEGLLIEAETTNTHVEEANVFTRLQFTNMLASTNEDALKVLYDAAGGLNFQPFRNFARALASASADNFNLFCQEAPLATRKKFFTRHFHNYGTQASFRTSLDTWLTNDNAPVPAILESLTSQQFAFYIKSSPTRFALVIAIADVREKFKLVLNGMDNNDFNTVLTTANTNEVRTIMDTMRTVSKAKTAIAIKELTQGQFNTYLQAKADLSEFCQSGVNDKVLQAIFTQFRLFGITFDAGTKNANTPAGQIYQGKLENYYWRAYTG